MKKFFLAAVAAVSLAGAAQATTFNGSASFSPDINAVNPGLQAKAVVLSDVGAQGFSSVAINTTDLNLGDSFSLDLFVVRTLQTIAAADDFLPKAFGLVFSFAQGTATITGNTYAQFDGVNTFGVIDFDGPGVIALGGGEGLFIELADATFNSGPGNTFTPGKANGAVIGATLSVATIPLPAAGLLLLLGLGGLAAVGRRRALAA